MASTLVQPITMASQTETQTQRETPTTTQPPAPTPTQDESRVGYLFGHPIAHSLSPIVHALVYRHLSLPYSYTLHESTDMASFLRLTRDPRFYGAAITMPHKVAILPHLHALTAEGAAVGAVNTVFARANPLTGTVELHGTNTDCVGIREALIRNTGPAGDLPAAAVAGGDGSDDGSRIRRRRPALVVGAGGTCRAAVYALSEWLACGPIYLLNRDAAEVTAVMAECSSRGFGSGSDSDSNLRLIHVLSAAQARALPPPAIIVSAIPDFPPQTDGELLVRDCLTAFLQGAGTATGTDIEEKTPAQTPRGTLLEMCYHPSPNTAISRLAAESAWHVIPGTEAMVWQGLEQDRYWTGRDVCDMPVEEVKAAVAEALEEARRHV